MARLQNSPYFCVFKYARVVKQKVWNEAETRERDWEEALKKHGRVRLARFARVRLLRHALPISLLILRKKRLFAVYPVAQFHRKFTCISVYSGIHIAVIWAVLTKTCCGRFFENLSGSVSCNKACARVEFDQR